MRIHNFYCKFPFSYLFLHYLMLSQSRIYYQIPCAIIASDTFKKPAILAPST
ncbi:MAG: hypothetical protein K0S61_826 [Anaerocolumna sp.]|jgi:hypothetical protein|nr:hypothetical protein [Anaerocolumna sp.]